MRRLNAQLKSLSRDPPPEFFLASYFIGREWWEPPAETRRAGTVESEQLPLSDLPEFEP